MELTSWAGWLRLPFLMKEESREVGHETRPLASSTRVSSTSFRLTFPNYSATTALSFSPHLLFPLTLNKSSENSLSSQYSDNGNLLGSVPVWRYLRSYSVLKCKLLDAQINRSVTSSHFFFFRSFTLTIWGARWQRG